MVPFRQSVLLALCWGVVALPSAAGAASDLMVYPSRVVLTDRQRTAQVEIINSGQEQVTYQITLVKKRMTENGEFLEATDPLPGEQFADDMVKYSPRQVTLLPGASQTIRMLVKLPPNLPPGEFRSHIVFRKPPQAINELPQQEEPDPKRLSMRIVTNLAVSIPVIVRHGKLSSSAAIDPASVKASSSGGRQQLSFTLSRTGTRSLFGDVAVYRGEDRIAEAKGLAVYVPNDRRHLVLSVPEGQQLKAGDLLRVVFTDSEDNSSKAEATAILR